MEPVLCRIQKHPVTQSPGEGSYQKRGTSCVGGGVTVRNGLREQSARALCGQALLRDKHHYLLDLGLQPDELRPVRGRPCDSEATHQAGRNIVWVPFDIGGETQRSVVIEEFTVRMQCARRDNARDDRGRGRSKATTMGNPIPAPQPDSLRLAYSMAGSGLCEFIQQVECLAQHFHDEVPLSPIGDFSALPVHLNGQSAASDRDFNVVIEREREPQRVEAWAQVGTGRWCLYSYRLVGPTHRRPLRSNCVR